MKELEELDFEDVAASGFTKKELLIKSRELAKLHKSLGGIRNLTKTPSAMWVVDPKREHLAIDEARKLGIPVIGILDTNADPDELAYPIPGNDDAIRSVALLTRIIADAAAEGLIERHQKTEPTGNVSAVEPLAEWERELLEAGNAEAAAAESTEAPAEAAASETPAGQTEGVGATVAENDADAAVAATEPTTDAVPEHAPETAEQVEATIEAEATEAEKKPAAKKPAAKKAKADAADAEPAAETE